MADEADLGGQHSVGLWQAPIKSRRRSSVGDGRHSESRSDPHRSTVAKRVSPPPPENPTSPAGHHRSEQQPSTEQLRHSDAGAAARAEAVVAPPGPSSPGCARSGHLIAAAISAAPFRPLGKRPALSFRAPSRCMDRTPRASRCWLRAAPRAGLLQNVTRRSSSRRT
jgi:hypothetical protein